MEETPFGRYRLIEVLGRGGMGEVWRAFDTGTERIVAVKVLPTHLIDDTLFQQRFRREARAAASLDEPHVVPIYDFGDIDGRLFVSMRLIEGEDLQAVLDRGPLSPQRAVRIIVQIASALDAAHEVGLVHRDVKPHNILVAKDDFSYLIDFGIARSAGETKLTGTGAMVGTLEYMAPERLTAGTVDARADVYALTCVLHECLTGQLPYPGDSLEQQITAHLTLDPPKPSAINPAVPAEFDEVIARGMAKVPVARFQSAGELARGASVALVHCESHTATAPRRKPDSTTRQFSKRWPNASGTGYTPYEEDSRQPEIPSRVNRFGRGQIALGVAAVALLLTAAVGVLWMAFGLNRGENTSTPDTTADGIPAALTTAPSLSAILPRTDTLGFLDYPKARCDPGNPAAALALTAKSALAVCQRGPGNYYYRGYSITTDESIELGNAVRSSAGWDVTNPADGTWYKIRPDTLTISYPGITDTEPILRYASS